ncbi:MBL fold metallo-hydrolase [Priestia megaterium]|uniref:MBL fold metallo-hydrolase n=1 Tax=Priestia megaterium TaxID=1404 RepID=UPI000CA32C4F|nr:MBL fold metallo-hydrolase [Priestia megaterium]AUO13991.1 MBL fold metallo-hydrolase [Priestia megaterium]
MIQYKTEQMTVFESALFQTTSAVIETKDCVIVVDPTWLPHEINEIKQHVQEILNHRNLYVFFTHGDFDHVIGYGAFLKLNATFIGSKFLEHHPEKEEKVQMIKQFDHDYYIKRSHDIIFPELDIVVTENEQHITLGETSITCYFAKGHTNDGLFMIVDDSIWIAGDYLSDFEYPYIYESVNDYRDTLATARHILAKNQNLTLVPGHGKTTHHRAEIQRRVEMASSYLDELQAAVKENSKEALDKLNDKLAFPSDFTAQCHQKNVEIMKRELLS